MMQRLNKAGPQALQTIKVILQNTAKEDPKYRHLKKDNALLQKRVIAVPGAIPLLCLAGFELENDIYIMKEYDPEKVAIVLNAIPQQYSNVSYKHDKTPTVGFRRTASPRRLSLARDAAGNPRSASYFMLCVYRSAISFCTSPIKIFFTSPVSIRPAA